MTRRWLVRAVLAGWAIAAGALMGAPAHAAVSIKCGPYLQNVTTTSIVVMWQTDVPADSRVTYGETGQVSDPTLVTLHQVTLTGLTPNTQYHYQVTSVSGGEQVSSGDSTFFTAPAAALPFRFVAYGDTQADPVVHAAVVQSILPSAPRFVVDIGDFCDDGASADLWLTEFFIPAAPLLAIAPLFPALGNHEYNAALYYDYFAPPSGGGERGEEWYSFNYGNAHFTVLDTNAAYAPGTPQYQWLVNDLQSATAEWKFVVHHHPVYSSGDHGGDPYVQAYLEPLYEQYHVDVVFSGHEHLYERSFHSGVTYIVTGGGGGPLYAPNETPNPYQQFARAIHHHCTIDVNGASLLLRAVDTGGVVFDSVTLTHTTAPPVVDFTGNPMSGGAPLTVAFTDTSTNSPTSWLWTFGDGGSSTVQHPSHVYVRAGSYSVQLVAGNGRGSGEKTKASYITVTVSPPAANFGGSPLSGPAPLAVTFTDTSIGAPTSWAWSFGEGGTSTSQSPSHTYAAVGTYTVALTASNAGGTSTSTKANYLTATASAPVADFAAAPTAGTSPLTVTFADASTGTPTSWLWSFGDGATATTQNPGHTYSNAGTYSVTLSVANAGGWNTRAKTTYITVADAAKTLFSDDFESGLNWTQSGDTLWYTGSPKLDTHGVRLRYTGAIEKTISTVGYQNITVSFYMGAYALEWGESVRASWRATGSWTTLQSIADGNPAEDNQLHAYTFSLPTRANDSSKFALRFSMQGNALDDIGFVDNVVVQGVPLAVTPPAAGFSATPTTGRMPLTVSFSDTSTRTPTAWFWTFGDGSSSTLRSPSHTYRQAGKYSVSLTAVNGGGSGALLRADYITVNPPPPVAGFAATPTQGEAPLEVSFSDASSDHPTAWAWTFGDGGTSTLQNPSHRYTGAGSMTVGLTATNAGGSATATKAGYISVTSAVPVAGFTANPTSGVTPLTVTFTDISTKNPTAWSWSFGDGGASTVQNPSHVYTTGGQDTVTLVATNAAGSSTATGTVNVQAGHAVTVTASATPTSVISGGSTALSMSAADNQNHSGFLWQWSDNGAGGGFSPSASVPNPTYIAPINTTGQPISVTLTALATCCWTAPWVSGSAVVTLTVASTASTHIVSVTAAATPATVPSAGPTTLTASATDSSGHAIASWSWTDGGAGGVFSPSAAVQNPTYTAAANTSGGNRTVTLVVTATCADAAPASGQGIVALTVQPQQTAHTVTVMASANPTTLASGGTTALSMQAADSLNHTGFAWAWSDNGAGGTFSPSATVQNPTYTAATNTSGTPRTVTLTATAICKWFYPWTNGQTDVLVTMNSQ